jgi:hypothetical protein
MQAPSIAPDVDFVKVAQAGLIEAKAGVFRNITTRAEAFQSIAIFTINKHTASGFIALNALKNRAQLLPHVARHGVEFCGVGYRDDSQCALKSEQNFA